MDQRLRQAAQDGDIDAFYPLVGTDPSILEQIEFAMEMRRLKPSFARQPNQDGTFAPIHLALQDQNISQQLVLSQLQVDPDLVRLRGRGGETALRYAACRIGNLDLLARFIRSETALHISLKYDNTLGLRETILDREGNEDNTSVHIATSDNLPQGLKDAAQQGNIGALYDSIKANPNILKIIDEIPFVDTPLHIAAAAGHIRFAMEMMRLMPSFARKLNEDGYSPIHLALKEDNNTRMVLRLVHADPHLVRVKGREGLTPLHYVAAKDDLVNVLAEFLVVCPDSIQDLTIRDETAMHIALKNNMLSAFKVLLGWVQKDSDLKKNILNRKDDEGNTPLHIATFKNQPQVVRLLIKNKVDVNAMNLEDLTALDILQRRRLLDPGEMKDMLQSAKGKIGTSLPKPVPIAAVLMWEAPFLSILNIGTSFMSQTKEHTSLILVVAVLIATATFTAGITPPGGLHQVQTNHINPRTNTSYTLAEIRPLMRLPYYYIFQTTNSTAFFASMGLIILLFPITFPVFLVEYSLIVCYFFSVSIISPFAFGVILCLLLMIPTISFCIQVLNSSFRDLSSINGGKNDIMVFYCYLFVFYFPGIVLLALYLRHPGKHTFD